MVMWYNAYWMNGRAGQETIWLSIWTHGEIFDIIPKQFEKKTPSW